MWSYRQRNPPTYCEILTHRGVEDEGFSSFLSHRLLRPAFSFRRRRSASAPWREPDVHNSASQRGAQRSLQFKVTLKAGVSGFPPQSVVRLITGWWNEASSRSDSAQVSKVDPSSVAHRCIGTAVRRKTRRAGKGSCRSLFLSFWRRQTVWPWICALIRRIPYASNATFTCYYGVYVSVFHFSERGGACFTRRPLPIKYGSVVMKCSWIHPIGSTMQKCGVEFLWCTIHYQLFLLLYNLLQMDTSSYRTISH